MRTKILLLSLITFFCIDTYSQITFEQGYFINEKDQKTECLIKNMDWKNNPTEFEYKFTQESIILKAEIDSVKEFSINNASKYIRAEVKMDKSSNYIHELDTEKNPTYQDEKIFLKVLIEGKFSLFQYDQTNLTRFFYKTDDSEITPLVYKSYLVDGNVAYNNYFRQQLSIIAIKYPEITQKVVESVEYNKKDLDRIFRMFNKDVNLSYAEYNPRNQKQKKDLFHIAIRPGINISNLKIYSPESYMEEIDFDPTFNARFGIEAEILLPFNKNKWALTIEPTYAYYKSKISQVTYNFSADRPIIAKVKYQSVEIPLGLRYYLYFNEDSKLFLNFSPAYALTFNSSIEITRDEEYSLEAPDPNSCITFAFGLGYKFKDKFGLEVRYLTNRDIVNKYRYWSSDFNTLSAIFGYTIF